jgi:hypothetical protein
MGALTSIGNKKEFMNWKIQKIRERIEYTSLFSCSPSSPGRYASNGSQFRLLDHPIRPNEDGEVFAVCGEIWRMEAAKI